MSNNVECRVPYRVVLDSDGLIKLAKAGILETVVSAWDCLIPRAVYHETVERGKQAGYPDAVTIGDSLQPSMVHPRVRHARAANLLEGKHGLGRGEQDALHLFFSTRADGIVTDDAAFVSMLDQARIPYVSPALVLVQLTDQGLLEPRAALEGLERMRPSIRREVYLAVRHDLESRRATRQEKENPGEPT